MSKHCLAVSLALTLSSMLSAGVETAKLIEGRKVYAERCVVCHGPDAHGTDRAPALAGSRRLRALSTERQAELIRKGIPSAGMPAFDLPPHELHVLATFVHSLNSPAAESIVPGDLAAGKQFFLGQGQCFSCHMVNGSGASIGPDLSNVGRELTADEIRESLLQPSAHIAPGYQLVTVQLPDGRTIRGFARSSTNFGMVLQDLEGQFHALQAGEISAVKEDKESLMQPVRAGPEELRDLTAYLSRLTGVDPGIPASPRSSAAGGFDFSRILDPKGSEWPTYNGKVSGNRYSKLTQINNRNVKQLAVKWIFPLSNFGLETTPIVADGIMYVTAPNQAFALDALTGALIWHYSRPRTPGLVGDASLGTNRGAALLRDSVFMVTDNAHLIALDRITGSLRWEAAMPDEPQHYGSTVAPLVVKDMVIAGVSGGDWGIRGFIAAYKGATGERVWRHWTIPHKGEPGYETWKGKDPEFGGGSTWLTGSYDAETDTLFWPTGNPFPDSDDRDRGGDNLFTDCILALNPDTGELKWHYQFTPHDVHDWDATEPPVLVDTRYRGQDRRLLLHADRNGFFYVLDRTNGELLLAKQFIRRLTWASGIGPDGRPLLASKVSDGVICPADEATNWNAAAFSPVTRLYYVMALEKCKITKSATSWKEERPKLEAAKKYLRAIDIETGNIAWEKPQIGSAEEKTWAGVLGTAGGILFYGDPSGAFVAADERNGEPLWHFSTNGVIKASPMTYMAGGNQFVAIAAGSNIISFGLAR